MFMATGTVLKSLLQEMKDRTNYQTECLRSQIQNLLETIRMEDPIVGRLESFRTFDSNHVQTQAYSVEVMNPENFTPLQSNSTGISKVN